MSDRALIFFTNGVIVSSAVDLHQNGSDVPSLLAAAAKVVANASESPMHNVIRIDAPKSYAVRFVSACVAAGGGNIGFGSRSIGEELEDAVRRTVQPRLELIPAVEARQALRAFSREVGLEAGLVVVNVRRTTWSWRAFGGRLQSRPRTSDSGWFEVVAPEVV